MDDIPDTSAGYDYEMTRLRKKLGWSLESPTQADMKYETSGDSGFFMLLGLSSRPNPGLHEDAAIYLASSDDEQSGSRSSTEDQALARPTKDVATIPPSGSVRTNLDAQSLTLMPSTLYSIPETPSAPIHPPALTHEISKYYWSFVKPEFSTSQPAAKRHPTYNHHSSNAASRCPSLTSGSSRSSSSLSFRSDNYDMVSSQEEGYHNLSDRGTSFEILKSRLLSHQVERPEKCPITSCEYRSRGFARSYDRIRHTCAHFRGDLICGFCSDTTDVSARVFNRMDMFARHLNNVHGAQEIIKHTRKHAIQGLHFMQHFNVLEKQSVASCNLCLKKYSVPAMYVHLTDCVIRNIRMQIENSTDAEWSTDVLDAEDPALDLTRSTLNTTKNQYQTKPEDGVARSPTEPYETDDDVHREVTEPHVFRGFHSQLPFRFRESAPTADEIHPKVDSTKSSRDTEGDSDEETDESWSRSTNCSSEEPDEIQLVLSPMKRRLVDRVMQEFHQLFDANFRVTTHNNGDSSNSQNVSTRSSAKPRSSDPPYFRHRKRKGDDGDPSRPPNEGDDPHKRRRPSNSTPVEELRFACPYYKRSPLKHRAFTSCRDPGFVSVARLKEHLYRRHALPIQCNRCCETFETDFFLRKHQRDERGCEIKEQAAMEGFDKEQERKLKSKKRSLGQQTEEEKWKAAYRVLFPDDDEDQIPNPYCDYQLPKDNDASPNENDEFSRFEAFARVELPRLVRRTLEEVVEREAQPLEERLKDELVNIVRNCQTQLFSSFQDTQSHHGTPASGKRSITETPKRTRGEVSAITQPPVTSSSSDYPDFSQTFSDPMTMSACSASEYSVNPKPSDSPDSGYDSLWNTQIQHPSTLPFDMLAPATQDLLPPQGDMSQPAADLTDFAPMSGFPDFDSWDPTVTGEASSFFNDWTIVDENTDQR